MNKKRFIKRIFVFVLGYIFGAFLANSAFAQTTENSLLWKISGKHLKQPSYLFGTIHIACNNGELLSSSVQNALEATERVVLEIDMDDPNMMQTMQKLSMNEGMKNFSTEMNEEDKALVDAFYMEKYKVGLAQLGIMKPFVLLSMMYPSYLDCEKQTAVEMLLIQAATKDKKEVLGLESVEYQIGVFDQIPVEEQIEMLVTSVKEFDKYKADFAKLTETYKAQDIVALFESFKQYPEYAKYEDIFLTNRNKNWIAKIESFMEEKPSFFGVGAAHLASENGVINLLREAGYTLTPVNENEN